MNIYLIHPVRNSSMRFDDYVESLEASGHTVHYPLRDAPQDDPTGRRICWRHRDAMLRADEVHVIWDVNSKGSHFDLGMAYALCKKIVPVQNLSKDPAGKSYWKSVINPLPISEESG